MAIVTQETARRPRAFVRVQGADAVSYLDRMLTNDVPEAGSVDALLLTPKARVIAPVNVWRRGEDDVLLLTEPELGEALQRELLRSRFAARCEIEVEQHESAVVFGEADGIPNRDYGVPAVELLDAGIEPTLDAEELERRRIEAATPRFGAEIDDRVLPAEAGLDERAISFDKGCFPGQEPVARQHYRGKVNRRLRVLELDGPVPEPGTPLALGEKEVGRITSAVPGLALAYVRVEVPDDAELTAAGTSVRLRPSHG